MHGGQDYDDQRYHRERRGRRMLLLGETGSRDSPFCLYSRSTRREISNPTAGQVRLGFMSEKGTIDLNLNQLATTALINDRLSQYKNSHRR